jgi:nucleoside phosphorylase
VSEPAANPATGQLTQRDRTVGVVFAESRASGCFEDRLSAVTTLHGAGFTVQQGTLEKRPIVVLLAGDTPHQPGRAVDALISGHRPGWIIAAGLAHGLDDRLRRGDLLLADRVVDGRGNELLIAAPFDPAQLARQSKLRTGRLLSINQPLRRPEEKRDLGCRFEAMVADPVAFEIAAVCQRERVPFLAVHVVADAVDDLLPADVAHWAGRPSLVRRLGALAGALVHRPGSAKDMWNYYESSVAASAALAEALTGLIRLLT